MKEIVCSWCDKKVLVEDSYSLKTCPICLAKLKSKRSLDRESKKLIRSLKFENKIPRQKHLGSFSAFQPWFRKWFNKEPIWDNYVEALNQAKLTEIYDKEDSDSADMHLELEAKKRKAKKMFHKDLYPFTNQKDCERFRYMVLGVYARERLFLEDHSLECDECRLWHEQYEQKLLPSQEENSFWSKPRKKSLDEMFDEKLACPSCGTRLNGAKTCPNCGNQKFALGLESVRAEQKERTEELERLQRERAEKLDRERMEKIERREALEEHERIRRMPKDQIQQWLDSPEETD